MASACEERWQTSKSTLLERNKYMFNNPVISDIKFAFPNHDKRVIPAHKYVLAISSPVFFAMFYGGLPETRETIEIADCDPDIFLQFLRFLYYDDASFQDANNAIQLWYLADKYDVPSLATKCANFLDVSMEPLNAFDIIPHARYFNHEELEKCCWEVIDYNAKDIIADDSFLELKHDFLLQFVKRSSLRITEVMLFEAVNRWAAKRCEEANMAVDGANKRSVLGEDLVKNVRFLLMSPQEFSNVVLPLEILFNTEIIDVFKKFTSLSRPDELKVSSRPRAGGDVSIHSCAVGSVWSGRNGDYNSLPYYIRHTTKTGVLTFTLSNPISLSGVKIFAVGSTYKPSVFLVSVVVTCRGKIIRIVKNKKIVIEPGRRNAFDWDAELDVFFNRPIQFFKDTCCSIETTIDTTKNQDNSFVWSASLLESKSQKAGSSADNANPTWPLSGLCSGQYTDYIPANGNYKGEVMALFYEYKKKNKDVRKK